MSETVDIRRAEITTSWRTAKLTPDLSIDDICERLGFVPNGGVDHNKVTVCWEFTVNGSQCAVWDYKGVRWSAFGPGRIWS